jgi:hypothetical protein
MRISRIAALFICGALLAGDGAGQQRPVLSPRDSVFLSLDTNVISVNYSRPSMRGRKIMGELVPWNKVWRTGANLATHLRTSFDMVMGGVPVPRGTYTLWTLPSPTGWKIILNKQTGQWGTNYDVHQDLARFDARVETITTPVDTFIISLLATGKTSGSIKLMWENTAVSTVFDQNEKIRPISPPDSSETKFRGKKVKIKYSRPFMRGREIWGVVVPYDSIWRTGANLTTTLTTDADLRIGQANIPAGAYTVYALPTEKKFTLIISKKPAGFPAYDPAMDAARIDLVMTKAAAPVDPFRIWFDATKKGTMLRFGWAERVYSIPVRAK